MWIQSLFLALLLVILFQARYFPARNFKSLRYRRYFVPDVVNVGESTTLVEEIGNARLLPIPWIRVEAAVSPDLVFGQGRRRADRLRQFHRSLFSIPAYTTITRRHPVCCPKRGYYHIKTVTLTTGDVLGMGDKRSLDYPTDTALTVYPALVPIEDVFSLRSSFTGDIVVRRWIVEDPFFIRGVRAYESSDPQNRINWKATAKTGAIQVHNYDYTADIRLMLILNIDTHEGQWSVTSNEACAERAVSLAASIAQYALENGVATGFVSNSKLVDAPELPARLAPSAGAQQLTALLTLLSKLTYSRRATFQTLLAGEAEEGLSGCDILVLSAYSNALIEEQLERLRARGNSVEILFVDQSPPDAAVQDEESPQDEAPAAQAGG